MPLPADRAQLSPRRRCLGLAAGRGLGQVLSGGMIKASVAQARLLEFLLQSKPLPVAKTILKCTLLEFVPQWAAALGYVNRMRHAWLSTS
jgi:hypothetical protein